MFPSSILKSSSEKNVFLFPEFYHQKRSQIFLALAFTVYLHCQRDPYLKYPDPPEKNNPWYCLFCTTLSLSLGGKGGKEKGQ